MSPWNREFVGEYFRTTEVQVRSTVMDGGSGMEHNVYFSGWTPVFLIIWRPMTTLESR